MLFNHTSPTSGLTSLKKILLPLLYLSSNIESLLQNKRKKKSIECSTSTKRPTQNLLKVCIEAALVILDLANKYFLWKPGDKMSPVNEIDLK